MPEGKSAASRSPHPAWKVVCLKLDDSSAELADYFSRRQGLDLEVRALESSAVLEQERISRTALLEGVTAALGDLAGRRIITVYGHGRYHHLTFGLCAVLADSQSDEYCYVHIDHHADNKPLRSVSCWNFTRAIARKGQTNAQEVLRIGPSFRDRRRSREFGVSESELIRHGPKLLLDYMPLISGDVYLSFDLDVMAPEEIETHYDRGSLTIEGLVEIIRIFRQEKNLIGADVLGYSRQDDLKSMILYDIVVREVAGQDSGRLISQHRRLKARARDRRRTSG